MWYLNASVFDWLIDCLIAWLLAWFIDWFVDWLIAWLIDCLLDWLVDWLFDCGVTKFHFQKFDCRGVISARSGNAACIVRPGNLSNRLDKSRGTATFLIHGCGHEKAVASSGDRTEFKECHECTGIFPKRWGRGPDLGDAEISAGWVRISSRLCGQPRRPQTTLKLRASSVKH